MQKISTTCEMCGCKVLYKHPSDPTMYIASSDYEEGFPYCHTCLIEHCLSTNCFACSLRKYPDCTFVVTKQDYLQYRKEEQEEAKSAIPLFRFTSCDGIHCETEEILVLDKGSYYVPLYFSVYEEYQKAELDTVITNGDTFLYYSTSNDATKFMSKMAVTA